MPPPELDGRHQKCVLWAKSSEDSMGEVKVSKPTEIDVRWNDTHRETTDADGNTVLADATVVVDRDIEVGSLMKLAKLKDISNARTTGAGISGLVQVVRFNKTPDVKGRFYYRECFLQRFKDVLPQITGV